MKIEVEVTEELLQAVQRANDYSMPKHRRYSSAVYVTSLVREALEAGNFLDIPAPTWQPKEKTT